MLMRLEKRTRLINSSLDIRKETRNKWEEKWHGNGKYYRKKDSVHLHSKCVRLILVRWLTGRPSRWKRNRLDKSQANMCFIYNAHRMFIAHYLPIHWKCCCDGLFYLLLYRSVIVAVCIRAPMHTNTHSLARSRSRSRPHINQPPRALVSSH